MLKISILEFINYIDSLIKLRDIISIFDRIFFKINKILLNCIQ